MHYEPDAIPPASTASIRERVSMPGIFLAVIGVTHVLAAGYRLFSGYQAADFPPNAFAQDRRRGNRQFERCRLLPPQVNVQSLPWRQRTHPLDVLPGDQGRVAAPALERRKDDGCLGLLGPRREQLPHHRRVESSMIGG